MALNRLLLTAIAILLLLQVSRADTEVDYLTQVKPLLSKRCYTCHSALRQQGGLRLDTAMLLASGGDSGAALQAGNSGKSLLVQMVTGELGMRMPPEEEGPGLEDSDIEILRRWIDQGAHAPEEAPPPDPQDHWAYQPPQQVAIPELRNEARATNPIDAFLASSHEAVGLVPTAAAEKEVLLRRVYLDLIGLPPTSEELRNFLANSSPEAYEQAVDRLLASPQYGERWGRHWMDVWRYSDWSGYQQEVRNSARHIWQWRDWIIQSLNDDKGYDRMVQEMLAGDELAPTDPGTLRATGFLVRNWYKFNRNTWLDSTIEHTAKAFLGVTMNCARCHDHKFDPISQVDYFRFRAIFEPHDVRTDRVPGEPDLLKAGLPRAFDLKLEEPTYLYLRGDEKRPDHEQRLEAGVPPVLGGNLRIEPIALPPLAYYPALREFAVDEELSRAAERVQTLEQEVHEAAAADIPLVTAKLITARTAQASLRARISADRAKHGLDAHGDLAQLAAAAARAEREVALCQALERELTAREALAAARDKQNPADPATKTAVAEAESEFALATENVEAARASLADTSTEYESLGTEYPRTSTGRRLAFAKWITDRQNPLTARVAINHIWLRHFGTPLVENAFDFGLRTPPPRHQALLDWLAVELMEGQWRMKRIHRLIVTSSAYRMGSTGTAGIATNVELDPDNYYLWRMNSRRLEAEAVRDAILHVAGSLDSTLGGPEIAHEEGQSSPRRSIYFRHAYEKQMQLLSVFDGPNVNECYRRSESVVPQQALALANSALSLDQSRLLASRLPAEIDDDFIAQAFQKILSRSATAAEIEQCRQFLDAQSELLRKSDTLTPFDGSQMARIPPASDPRQRARENLIHVLFNHNDFIMIH